MRTEDRRHRAGSGDNRIEQPAPPVPGLEPPAGSSVQGTGTESTGAGHTGAEEIGAQYAASAEGSGKSEAGMATAEYAIATLAAVGFAGLLVAVLQSGEVRGLLLSVIERALSF